MAEPTYDGPTDKYGIPTAVTHHPQTELPIWQYIHKLETPITNPKNPDRPHTHICVLCASEPPFRANSGTRRTPTWRNALMRQRMSTNAVSHVQRVHPDEFVGISDYMKVKRERIEAGITTTATGSTTQPKKKRVKKITGTTKKISHLVENTQGEKERVVADVAAVPARKRPVGKTSDLVKNWLMSSGFPPSVLQDEALQNLLRLSVSVLPTTLDLNVYVQEEFTRFGGFLKTFLAAEAKAAIGLPFLSLRHEFHPILGFETEVSSQQKAFLSVAIGFIDAQWRRVDLVLTAKTVPRGWGQQVNQLVNQTISETYGTGIANYARFHVDVQAEAPAPLAASGDYEPSTDDHEDLLTRTLRSCVIDALGVGSAGSCGGETSVRRLLRLLQELAKYFKAPDRANALAAISASHGVTVPFHSTSIDELATSTWTSVGAVAELLRISCTQYPAYWLYFQSPLRPTVAEPELEAAWIQLSVEDWNTATELEAIIYHLAQFHLEERIAPRQGAVAPSYAQLFRRLLSVTTNAANLKCLSLEDAYTAEPSAMKRMARRKAKQVETFTSTGKQCLARLRQLTAQRFSSPRTPTDVDCEIKAMLLDPRISSKAAAIVTDKRAFRRALDDIREEHRAVFKILANRHADANQTSEIDEEDVDDDDDDEMSALLMVDGPKNLPPAAPSTSGSGRHSNDTVAEDEARAWREWQQVYVAWDTVASEGADLFDKGQYNLLKLYHHVDILSWFRTVGQQAHPAASLLARIYLGQQYPPSRALGASLLGFTEQEEASWISGAAERAEQRCILHHNWSQYQRLSANALPSTTIDNNASVTTD